jgi:outer membrane protein TolC
MREFFRIVVVALAAAASIACNREVYMPQVEEIVSDSARYVMPESHYGISADTASAARIKRYDFYTDRHLRQIIDTALAANPSIRIAVLQIEEAEAYFRRSRRERLPEVTADLSASYTDAGYGRAPMEDHLFRLGASWEIDIWGRLKSLRKAQAHKLMQSVAAANAVRTRIIADAAALYYRLIILDARRISVEQSISRNDSIVTGCNILIDAAAWEKSDGEKRAKLLPHAQMVREQAASELYASKAELPDIEAEIFITQNTLNRLLGRTDGELPRSSVEKVFEQSMFRDSIAVGIPAQLLRNRPDIIAAEEQLFSDYDLTRAAQAALYPRLTLKGDVGLETRSMAHWFDLPSALLYNAFAGLTQPLFRRGELRMQRRVREVRQSVSFMRLRDAVLAAQCEVSNTMMRYASARRRVIIYYSQVGSLRQAMAHARQLMSSGGSYLDVWAAQTRLLQAEKNLYNAMLTMFDQRIALYRELGGGWR